MAAALGAALMPKRGWGGGDTAGAAGAWKPAACLDEGCNERSASKIAALKEREAPADEPPRKGPNVTW